MQNAGLDESQSGIKISRRNINNLRYTDYTTLMAESEEELNSLLMRVKEDSEKLAYNSHIHTWLLENHNFDYTDLCWESDVSTF